MAQAGITAATPTAMALDDAGELARDYAVLARDQYREWRAEEGQALDRVGYLLDGIRTALDGGNADMQRAILSGGMAEAMRVQAARGLAMEDEQADSFEADGNVVGFRRLR